MKYNYLTVGLSHWQATSQILHSLHCTSPNYCFHHPSLTRQDILPLISVWKRNRASTAGMSLSLKLVCEFTAASLWGQRVRRGWPCHVCWRRWVRAGVITHCLSPSKTHEGGLCLPHCEEEGEGALTAQQRVAGGGMRPIFSSEPERLFKDEVLGVVFGRGGGGNSKRNVARNQLTQCCLVRCCSVIGEHLCVCVLSL